MWVYKRKVVTAAVKLIQAWRIVLARTQMWATVSQPETSWCHYLNSWLLFQGCWLPWCLVMCGQLLYTPPCSWVGWVSWSLPRTFQCTKHDVALAVMLNNSLRSCRGQMSHTQWLSSQVLYRRFPQNLSDGCQWQNIPSWVKKNTFRNCLDKKTAWKFTTRI